MLKKLVLVCLMGLSSLAMGEPVKIILDTDLASDCDDAGAVAGINALADNGEVDLLAIMISTGGPCSAPTAAAICKWYGREVPIGQLKEPRFWSGGSPDEPSGWMNFNRYTQPIAAKYPTALKSGEDAPDARTLYRKILASQPDGSVTINTIGALINLHYLLDTPADDISPLTGVELVKKKVQRLVVCGGRNPKGTSSNFSKAGTGVHTVAVFERWPTPIVFCGNEVGGELETGFADSPEFADHPSREAYKIFHNGNPTKKRASNDQAGMLYAIRGEGDFYTLSDPGVMVSDEKGNTHFEPKPDGSHRYLIKRPNIDQRLRDTIEKVMNQPRKTR